MALPAGVLGPGTSQAHRPGAPNTLRWTLAFQAEGMAAERMSRHQGAGRAAALKHRC